MGLFDSNKCSRCGQTRGFRHGAFCGPYARPPLPPLPPQRNSVPGYNSKSAQLLRQATAHCAPVWTPETGWTGDAADSHSVAVRTAASGAESARAGSPVTVTRSDMAAASLLAPPDDGIVYPPAVPYAHNVDADCHIGPDGACIECGAETGDPCEECGARIWHVAGCSELAVRS